MGRGGQVNGSNRRDGGSDPSGLLAGCGGGNPRGRRTAGSYADLVTVPASNVGVGTSLTGTDMVALQEV